MLVTPSVYVIYYNDPSHITNQNHLYESVQTGMHTIALYRSVPSPRLEYASSIHRCIHGIYELNNFYLDVITIIKMYRRRFQHI